MDFCVETWERPGLWFRYRLGPRRFSDFPAVVLDSFSRVGLLVSALVLGILNAGFGDTIEFNRDIRPILSENCFACHGQDGNKRAADLRLDRQESAVESGAIVPGEPDESELVSRIESDDPDIMMPPADSNRQLTKEQKQRLRDWIADGARFERHWSFVAPVRPVVPTVRNSGWCRNPIDHFVLAKLESVGDVAIARGGSRDVDQAVVV